MTSCFSFPSSFTDWLDKNNKDSEINLTVIQPIIDLHESLRSVSYELIENLKNNRKPPHQNYCDLKNLVSSFLSSIRRLEKDSAMKLDGMDEYTGLRPKESIKHDLDKEMERLARNGNSFSLVLVRIDDFESIYDRNLAISVLVDNIKKSMRPFDDAYSLDDGKFLLSLKHADMVGANAAISRIQYSLKTDINNIENITISCAMSEPVMGDQVFELLKNMDDDLNNHLKDKEAILRYLDISPLERFIGTRE